MTLFEQRPAVHFLADISAGERVIVREIPFVSIRGLCGSHGMTLGDVVRCEVRRSHTLVLETSAGRSLELDRFYACFVEVEAVPAS